MIPRIGDFRKNSIGSAAYKVMKLMSTSIKTLFLGRIKSSAKNNGHPRGVGLPMLEVNQKNKIICNGCKICERACPSSCIEVKLSHHHEVKMNIDYSRCLSCFVCEQVCPINAITLKARKHYLGGKDKYLVICQEKLVHDEI